MGQPTSMRRRWLRVIQSAEADLVADQAEQGAHFAPQIGEVLVAAVIDVGVAGDR